MIDCLTLQISMPLVGLAVLVMLYLTVQLARHRERCLLHHDQGRIRSKAESQDSKQQV